MSADSGRGRRNLLVALVAGIIVLALVAFGTGRWSASPTTPSTTSAEAGFARDMHAHHLQAVEMSYLVRDATDDPEIRLLAYDIANAQAHQAGQMFGWLETWGLPQAPAQPPMTWMGGQDSGDHDEHEHDTAEDHTDHGAGSSMPGMATREELLALSEARDIEAERLFLQLMIEHHRGGVEMAQAVLALSAEPVVVALADSIVASQESEIVLMEDLLAARQD